MDEKLTSDSWTYSIKKPEKECRLIKIHTGVWLGNSFVENQYGKLKLSIRIVDDEIDFVHFNLNSKGNKELLKKMETEFMKLKFDPVQIEHQLDRFESEFGLEWSLFFKDEWRRLFEMIDIELKKVSGGR